ncbi:MAG: hypothetical protein Q8N44_06680 [Rubrivivax sp.]|nr:hypothetical protein [Rubrivivax sp.]MDP3083361.1 hypothetical protein [Rubrivivax sp.]
MRCAHRPADQRLCARRRRGDDRRRHTEQALARAAASRHRSDFLASTRDELRTPLNAFVGGLTARALSQDRDDCLKAGMQAARLKPFSPTELWACIHEGVAGA